MALVRQNSRRAPRPKTLHVPVADLFDAWAPLARLRDTSFEWDGSAYSKPSRNLSCDRSGLEAHKDALMELVRLAPTGFPAHASVREALLQLDSRFNIFAGQSNTFKVASDAADVWRVMCRDLYDLKKIRGPVYQWRSRNWLT